MQEAKKERLIGSQSAASNQGGGMSATTTRKGYAQSGYGANNQGSVGSSLSNKRKMKILPAIQSQNARRALAQDIQGSDFSKQKTDGYNDEQTGSQLGLADETHQEN